MQAHILLQMGRRATPVVKPRPVPERERLPYNPDDFCLKKLRQVARGDPAPYRGDEAIGIYRWLLAWFAYSTEPAEAMETWRRITEIKPSVRARYILAA